jgi:hypothetical protein
MYSNNAISNVTVSVSKLEKVTKDLNDTLANTAYADEYQQGLIDEVNAIFDDLRARNKVYHKFTGSSDARKRSLHIAWANILARCNNPNHPAYPNYGGRGITCAFADFEAFARHVGFRPYPDATIGRIDNDRGYEPGNIRWESWKQQANNRRPPKVGHERAPWGSKSRTLH